MKRIIFLVLILGAAVTAVYMMQRVPKESLPIINPVDLKKEMVDSSLVRKGIGHRIGHFSFLNQDGKTVTDQDVRGKVYVVEYFFTTCGTICPQMNSQMQRVQKKFLGNPNFKILSFTVDPEIDTVAQIKKYATEHHAKAGQWQFLTGEKSKLYELARKSFFVLKPAETQNQGDGNSDFIHTNNFVLIDQKMRIRGYYDGTSAHEVDQLMNDIGSVMEEK